MRIDASHEFGTETWEQRARACAAELEETKTKCAQLEQQNDTLIIQAGQHEQEILALREQIRDYEDRFSNLEREPF